MLATHSETTTTMPPVGIWDAEDAAVFTRYNVEVAFTDWVVGGVPQNPELIESWLRQRIMGGDEELRVMLVRTLQDLEIEVSAQATREEIVEAAKQIAATRSGNTFRRDERGLYLMAYHPKAMLKEACAILYPGGHGGHKWGPTKKAPRSFLAERIFVDDARLYLGRMEPDGTHMQVGHVSGPKGDRSTLTYYDYCVRPTLSFTVSSAEDAIEPEQWKRMLLLGQRVGMGAMRSMGYGQFKITAFDRR